MLRRERGLDRRRHCGIVQRCAVRAGGVDGSGAHRAVAGDTLAGAPAHVRGDYPDWLDPDFSNVFGDDRAAEGAALASRAPLDLRVNTLKAEREEVAAQARAP